MCQNLPSRTVWQSIHKAGVLILNLNVSKAVSDAANLSRVLNKGNDLSLLLGLLPLFLCTHQVICWIASAATSLSSVYILSLSCPWLSSGCYDSSRYLFCLLTELSLLGLCAVVPSLTFYVFFNSCVTDHLTGKIFSDMNLILNNVLVWHCENCFRVNFHCSPNTQDKIHGLQKEC